MVMVIMTSSMIEIGVGEVVVTKDNPDNGHTYVLYNANESWHTAYNDAILQGYYLTTITTFSEYNFIITELFNLQPGYYAWIGGNTTSISGQDVRTVYQWANGPEFGIPIYDFDKSRCLGFCNFNIDQPDHNKQNNLYFWNNLAWDDHADGASVNGYIMEKGGEDDPVIYPFDMQPSVLTIGNLDKTLWNTSNVSVTFTNSLAERPSFDCPILSWSPSQITCQTQFTVGEYDITVTDGTQSFIHKKFHPNLPFITTIYPGFDVNSTMTINGQNFGDNITLIEAVIVSEFNIECIPIQYLVIDRSFTCRMTDSFDKQSSYRYAQISITVGGVPMNNIGRFGVYDSSTNGMLVFTGSTYPNVFNFSVEGYETYLYAPLIKESIDLIHIMVKNSIYYPTIQLNSAYYFRDGPLKGQKIIDSNGPNNAIFSNTSIIFDSSVSFYMSDENMTIYLDTSTGTLRSGYDVAEYSVGFINLTKPDPVFLNSSHTQLPTSGGQLVLQVDNIQLLSSSYMLMKEGGIQVDCSIIPIIENSSLVINVHSGYGSSKPLILAINGQTTTQSTTTNNANYLSFKPPTLSSVNITSTTLFTDGVGMITLFGDQFGRVPEIIKLNIVNDQGVIVKTISSPSQLSFIQDHRIIQLQYPSQSGHGSNNISITVDDQTSNIIKFTPPPTITIQSSTSYEYQTPGTITIKGTLLYQPLRVVTIGGASCANATLLDSERITCQYDGSAPPQSNSLGLPITVQCGQSITTAYKYVYVNNSQCGPQPYCSGNGHCEDGSCFCSDGFSGSLCEHDNTVPSNHTPSINTGNSTIDNFSVFFTHIREIDGASGNPEITYPVSSVIWNVTRNTSSTLETIGMIPDVSGFKINVTSIIFEADTNYTFAGQVLFMQRNSFKYQIEMEGWPFRSKNNYLQLVYELQNPKDTKCSQSQSTYNDANNLLWIQIKFANQLFLVKFSSRMLVDNRITASQAKILGNDDTIFQQPYYKDLGDSSRLLVAMVMPYFGQTTIDPNFSLLIDKSAQGDSDSCGSSFKWWWIVVAAGCTIVLAAIVCGIIYHNKKKRDFRKRTSMSLSKLNN
ncbi:hypothetical protein SAMD00019534_023470 [Acytostelium subglobosum LB1]|uniref:hypothetical protein n=1 Tax=Acytostelium subglobosum LB1 TaxID=1410327 RepID=UPI0006450014|nr:hypothetical protein SAMD00019534_023470 [Acytostelium subglobosum LB1]GAM19172.1 hypothetical protein SAMD00019534_023470 [Acytostelium subglobosum LB1]|eukprot:XP_012757099.1 hypothetical protein SAMD00019534_023470 [Acytostelium subglobosum LB1]